MSSRSSSSGRRSVTCSTSSAYTSCATSTVRSSGSSALSSSQSTVPAGYGSSSWRSRRRKGRVPRQTMLSRPSSRRSSTSATSTAQPVCFRPSSESQTMPNSVSLSRQWSTIVLYRSSKIWSGTTSVGSVTIPSGKRGKSLSDISRVSLSAGGTRIEGVGGTALVWIRRDLRVHDHPPLTAALARFDRVVPVFCLHPGLVHGRFESPARVWFLLESLQELRDALRARGSDLVFREGDPAVALVSLAGEVGASAAFFASDVSPYAIARDRRVRAALEEAGVEVVQTPGNFVADVSVPRTKAGRAFTVFSPFHRAWRELERREVHAAPS